MQLGQFLRPPSHKCSTQKQWSWFLIGSIDVRESEPKHPMFPNHIHSSFTSAGRTEGSAVCSPRPLGCGSRRSGQIFYTTIEVYAPRFFRCFSLTNLLDSVLTDIAKSVTLYLHDEASSHRVIAIELCSFGFQIWQHYVDAMEILRSLFTLATAARKDNDAASRSVASTARAAVLQIASSNTPLFMTTMSLDILQPKTPEYRNSIMQLIAFMIRKVIELE